MGGLLAELRDGLIVGLRGGLIAGLLLWSWVWIGDLIRRPFEETSRGTFRRRGEHCFRSTCPIFVCLALELFLASIRSPVVCEPECIQFAAH